MYNTINLTNEKLYINGTTLTADIHISNAGLVTIAIFNGMATIKGLFGVDFRPRVNDSTKPIPESKLCNDVYEYVCNNYLSFDYSYFTHSCIEEVAMTIETSTSIVIRKRII